MEKQQQVNLPATSNVHMTRPFERGPSILNHFSPFHVLAENSAPGVGPMVRVDSTAFVEELWRRQKEEDARVAAERRMLDEETERADKELKEQRSNYLDNKSEGYRHFMELIYDEIIDFDPVCESCKSRRNVATTAKKCQTCSSKRVNMEVPFLSVLPPLRLTLKCARTFPQPLLRAPALHLTSPSSRQGDIAPLPAAQSCERRTLALCLFSASVSCGSQEIKHDMLVTLRGLFRENIVALAHGADSACSNPSTPVPTAASTSHAQPSTTALVPMAGTSDREREVMDCLRLRYRIQIDPAEDDAVDFEIDEICALLDLLESHVSDRCCCAASTRACRLPSPASMRGP
jgi:hypothetical protein